MKITYTHLILFFVFISASSCNNSSNIVDSKILSVDISNIKEVSFFELFSKIELIPLETTDKSLIKDIEKIVFFDNKYFILDYRNAEILVFNLSGKYLHKISEKVNGPNQYFNIGDFYIDELNKTINILAPVNKSMYEYDISGNFITKYKLPDINGSYNKVNIINKDTLAFWTFDYDNRMKFYSKDKDLIISETFQEAENILNNFSFVFPYKTYIARSSSNSIYNITKDAEVVEDYKWDFGIYNNSINQINKFEQLTSNDIHQYAPKILNSENINIILTLHGASSQYYYTQLWRKNKRINVFYNKDDRNNSYVFDKTIEGAEFYPILWHDDYVIGLYSNDFGTIDNTIPDSILDNENRLVKENISDFDNPILIKYYFKRQ